MTKRKRLVSSAEASPAAEQHVTPCDDCPWRRDSLDGWLGPYTAEEWIRCAHGEGRIPCHTLAGQQCAGSAVYRANVCKLPRDPSVLRLPSDRRAVFSGPPEFMAHHGSDQAGEDE